MAPVARALAPRWGVLEPIQTATTLEGQVRELSAVLEDHAAHPATVVGFSWGAWLSLIVAARHPALVRKLILVGSGPFEECYVATLTETRMGRLTAQERAEYDAAIETLGDSHARDQDAALARLGALTARTDAYAPVGKDAQHASPVGLRGDIFRQVWEAAGALRRSGELLALAGQVQCPVVAIHGDHDPHPAAGVQGPLSRAVEGFCFILLERCGHQPWGERQAMAAFYAALKRELS
jgi:pimeloyl-ACP methyl ester carboxylesterase